MKPVNYDAIASTYDARYRTNRFEGIESSLAAFVSSADHLDVVELGCGTGHWLSRLPSRARTLIGLDFSKAMLLNAREAAPHVGLVRARAETAPFRNSAFDRAFCINAIHHFGDWKSSIREARRALRSSGGLLVIALDPHTGLDSWWIYDYFPSARIADLARYPSTAEIRTFLWEAGFESVSTTVAQRIPASVPFDVAVYNGLLDRGSTSQLQVISDDDWEHGIAKLTVEKPVLSADLRLWGTVGWVPSRNSRTGA